MPVMHSVYYLYVSCQPLERSRTWSAAAEAGTDAFYVVALLPWYEEVGSGLPVSAALIKRPWRLSLSMPNAAAAGTTRPSATTVGAVLVDVADQVSCLHVWCHV